MLSHTILSLQFLLLLTTFFFTNIYTQVLTEEETVLLVQGTAQDNVIFDSYLSLKDLPSDIKISSDVFEGRNIVTNITVAKLGSISESQSTTLLIEFRIIFRGLAGPANFAINVLYSNNTLLHEFSYDYFVVGIVLYQDEIPQDSKPIKILSGNGVGSGYIIRDDQLSDDPTLISFSSSVYSGRSIESTANLVDTASISLSISTDPPKFASLFPWARSCLINPETSEILQNLALKNQCAFGFSSDFSKFHIVMPSLSQLSDKFTVTITFLWPRIDKLLDDVETGVNTAQNRPSTIVTQLENSQLTSFTFEYIPGLPKSKADEREDSNSNSIVGNQNGIENWKIAVIVVTTVLIIIAILILVYCLWYTARLRNDDSNQKPSRIRDLLGLGHGGKSNHNNAFNDDDDDDEGRVDEEAVDGFTPLPMPPIDKRYLGEVNSNTASILLPEPNDISNSSDPHLSRIVQPSVEGLVRLEHQTTDKSVERLVLPKVVPRGVDLEPSTEGTTNTSYDPISNGDDETSFGRGMTSIPRDRNQRNHDKSTNENGVEVDTREAFNREEWEKCMSIFRDQGANGKPPSTNDLPVANVGDDNQAANGRPGTPNRDGVGAAINRVKQVNLLNGPASLGLVGRNGEPVSRPSTSTETGSVADMGTGNVPFQGNAVDTSSVGAVTPATKGTIISIEQSQISKMERQSINDTHTAAAVDPQVNGSKAIHNSSLSPARIS